MHDVRACMRITGSVECGETTVSVIGESRTLRRVFVCVRRCPPVSTISVVFFLDCVVSVRLSSRAKVSKLVSGV